MQADDFARAPASAWVAYLSGKNPTYPEDALRRDLANVRSRVAAMREDPTTPDTRLADDPMQYNPASITSLIELALAGLHPRNSGSILACRLRYFDPARRRAGFPEDVAALIDGMAADRVSLTLVNVNQLDPRTVIVQAGGYAEHRFVSAALDGKMVPIDGAHVSVKLSPGAGAKLVLTMKRFAGTPTMRFPWNQ
jgi:hypothetical protein